MKIVRFGLVLSTVVLQCMCFIVGDVVGRNGEYKLNTQLYSENGVELFAAENPKGLLVMLKIFSVKAMAKNDVLGENVEKDLSIRTKLEHANILKIDDTWNDGEYVFLVEEFCVGGRLIDVVSNQSLKEFHLKVYMRQLVSILMYLKEQRIVLDYLNLNTIYVCPNEEFSNWIKIESMGSAMQYSAESFDLSKSQAGVVLARNVMDSLFFASGLYSKTRPSHEAADLLYRMSIPDPDKRISIEKVLSHEWLKSEAARIDLSDVLI